MDGKIKLNLHCHSSLSDGALSPEDLAGRLADAGAAVAALTDHDSVEGSTRFREALTLRGVAFVDGVELTTYCEFGEIHLLAYGIDVGAPELLTTLAAVGESPDLELRGFMDHIRRLGSRPHAGKLETGAAIELTHRCGGIAVMAHPLETAVPDHDLEAVLDFLVGKGLDGVEALYGPYPENRRRELLSVADARGLCVSMGTDFHLPDDPEHAAVIEVDETRWKGFRDRLLRRSESAFDADKTSRANSAPLIGKEVEEPRAAARNRFKLGKYSARIITASVLALGLFIVALFAVSIPYFERTLLERKKEMIRELTAEAVSLIAEYQADETSGRSTRERAQSDAIAHIRDIRYGREGKDYFWITDSLPRMLMHPYRKDLEGRDVSDFKDDNGLRVFYEFSRAVREKSEGYVEYLWQWKDDADRIVPKLSYVKRFEPWDWIIGTGIYLDDVKSEIETLADRMIWLSCLIAVILLLLLAYIARQSLRMEQEKGVSEFAVRESKERYRALVEASTEGMAIVVNGVCTFANAPFLELSGYTEAEVVLMGLTEFLAPYDGEEGAMVAFLASLPKNEIGATREEQRSPDGTEKAEALACLFKTRSGDTVDVVVNATAFALAGKNVAVLAIKDARAGKTEGVGPAAPDPWNAAAADSIGLGRFRARLNRRAAITAADSVAQRVLGLPTESATRRVGFAALFRNQIEWDSFYAELVAVGHIVRRSVLLKNGEIAEGAPKSAQDRASGGETLITAFVEDADHLGERFFSAIIETPIATSEEIAEMREATSAAEEAFRLFDEPIARGTALRISMRESALRAAQKMAASDADALIVQGPDGEDVGIFTDADFRSRIVAEGRSADASLGPLMTAPLISLKDGATYAQALRMMEQRNIGHIAVRDANGAVVALVGRKDITRLQEGSFTGLLSAVSSARGVAELERIRRTAMIRASRSVTGGLRSKTITALLSSANDAIVDRVVKFALEELGPAPAPFAFLVLGSGGRSEFLPTSDQDNAIAYVPDRDRDGGDERRYFLRLGAFVCDALNGIGVPYCPGGVMAKNEAWCAPQEAWEQKFRAWISRPDAEELLAFNSCMDFRAVYDDGGIAAVLRGSIARELADNPGFFTHLARNALRRKPGSPFAAPLFQGTKGETDVDLKELSSQFVIYARLFALRDGLTETNTYRRIESLKANGTFESVLADECLDVYESLSAMRIARMGSSSGTAITSFCAREEACLREATAQSALIQKKIAFDFPGSTV